MDREPADGMKVNDLVTALMTTPAAARRRQRADIHGRIRRLKVESAFLADVRGQTAIRRIDVGCPCEKEIEPVNAKTHGGFANLTLGQRLLRLY